MQSAFAYHWKIKQTTKRKLMFIRTWRKQEGEFQDKANVKFPNHWASELGSI
jgi:hypothetical protein